MREHSIGRGGLALVGLVLAGLAASPRLAAQELSEGAVRTIQAILADKATWTPDERKLATSLLMAHRQSRGRAMVQGLGPFPHVVARARVDGQGMVVVDIRAVVTEDLLQTIADVGGEVISSFPSHEAVQARVPIRRVDAIAGLPEVRRVGPKENAVVNIGSATSQGDAAHAADAARTIFGIDGTGVRVGVLSDGVDSLADRQATNDLPPTCADPPAPGPCVAVVPGEGGFGDEGTAMLEIVHDLAPGAQLFFATAFDGVASFAANIQALRSTHGCDVIVDDVTYFAEGAFQDGPIAQAVNAVTAAGAIYFSSAGNSGRLSAGTSGTWEGDFVDSGTAIPFFDGTAWQGLPVHSFNGLTGGGAASSDQLTATAPSAISLKWSDPLGGSGNDYDVFIFDDTLTTLFDLSADAQTGTQDPLEIMGFGLPTERIVVVQFSGAGRALRLDTNRGRLSIATGGAVVGHNGGESTISVAATDGRTPGAGNPFTGGASNPVQPYSSDGPRRIFFEPDGSPITPGNLLFATNGGRVLQKPDFTAADCVRTTTPGFSPFCGTSAAAPHAAAVAALLLSLPSSPSGAQALAAMVDTALDVDPAGRDDDSGTGIVMAEGAVNLLTGSLAADFYTVGLCRVFDTRLPGGPTGGTPLACGIDHSFTMTGGSCGVPATARAISLNLTVTAPTAQGNVRLFTSGTSAPLASTLNYVAGLTRANNAVLLLSAGGQIALRCTPSGTTHVVVDVNGYFE